MTTTEKKASIYLQIVALMLGVGGIVGIGIGVFLEFSVLSHDTARLALTALAAVTIVPFLLSVWTGIGLWKKRSWAFTWAQVLLVAQIPYFNIVGSSYKFYTGLTFNVGYIHDRVNFEFQLGSSFTWQIAKEAGAFAFGINLAAVIALYLLGKAMVLRKEAATVPVAEV